MRRAIVYLILFPAIFAFMFLAPFGVRYAQQYGLLGGLMNQRAAPPTFDPAGIADRAPTPAANLFVDEPAVGSGYVLLDRAHANAFDMGEIAYLDGRLAARGYQLRVHQGGDLAGALRSASAYIVIAPLKAFTVAEVAAVTHFVENGGRVLLVGDPTRFDVRIEETFFDFRYFIDTAQLPLNGLSRSFGLTFNGDYLYNTVENEGNYRNIIIQAGGFAEHPLTDGLEQVVFYASHSIQTGPGAAPLLMADENTWSSATDRPGGLNLAALGGDGRVLALGDLSFLTEPYYTVFDNSQFIARIADFLTVETERTFTLADFPFFYQGPIDLVYTGQPDLGPDAFDEIIALQTAFRAIGQQLHLTVAPRSGHDALYLGLYNSADEAAAILEALNIELIIDPPLDLADEADDENGDAAVEDENGVENLRLIQSPLGRVQMSGTAVIALHEVDGRRHLVVLAASKEGLENMVERLLRLIAQDAASALQQCFLQDNLALCPSGVANEKIESKLETGGVPTHREDRPGSGNGGNGGGSGEPLDDLTADLQGTLSVGQTINGNLSQDRGDAWYFNGGPGRFTFVAESEGLDLALELYNPDNELIEFVDRAFSGGMEEMAGVGIPDSGRYTVVVRDYFGEPGSYTLSALIAEPPDLDAVSQGNAGWGETVSAVLAFNERHGWTLTAVGPVLADISLTIPPDSPLDPVMELYDPDGYLVERVDRNLSGAGEEILAVELGAGDYTILVFDYFGEPGGYELTVTANEFGDNGGGAVGGGDGRIFIFAADDGTPQTSGFTSAESMAAILTAVGYEVTLWSSAADGSLSVADLNGHDLLIWDSGDYRYELSFFDPDLLAVFEFVEAGGHLLLVGATPPLLDLLEPLELTTLSDVQFVGGDAILLAGFSNGQVVALDQSYQVIISDEEDITEGETFMVHGPASSSAGLAVGLAADDDGFRLAALIFPFTALPTAVQSTLLTNLVAWFGL